MKRIRSMLLAASVLAMGAFSAPDSSQAQGIPQNIPRKELLILENPEGTIKNAGWFNIWAINAGSQSNGLQQAALDTLWYIDPETRPRRRVGQFAGRRQAGLQRRLHGNAREAAPRHLLERRRRVHVRRREGDRRHPDQEHGHALFGRARQQCRVGRGAGRRDGHLQAEEAELTLPRQFHGALGRASGSCRSTSSTRSRTR